MATSTTISGLTALTTPATGDLFAIVDISDTTQAPTGSTRKITLATLFASPAFTGTATAAAVTATGVITASGGIVGTTATFSGAVGAGATTVTTLAMSGALTGATTGAFSSNVTVGGTLGVTGRITASADLLITTSTAPTTPGQWGYSSTYGCYIWSKGGVTDDFALFTGVAGGYVFHVPTGTHDLVVPNSVAIGSTLVVTGLTTLNQDVNLAATVAIGTATAADWYLKVNNQAKWTLHGATGHFLATADNVNDIGAAGANRPRTGYFGTSVVAPTFTGNAATATALATPRNINSVAFDGTANITVTAAAGTLTGLTLASNVVTSSITTVGALNAGSITSGFGSIDVGADAITGGTITGTSLVGPLTGNVTGNLTGNVTGNVSGTSGSTTGNAATATALQTARTINGVSFDGTANITISAVAAAGSLTGTTLASNVVTSSLTTVGTIGTGTWQGTSISTTYTDAKVKTVTGTASRLTVGGTATDPTFDVSTAYVGQATITTLGTITTGVWNGTAIANAYIAAGVDVAKLTTGTTLPGNVTASSLTSVGTLTSLTTSGTAQAAKFAGSGTAPVVSGLPAGWTSTITGTDVSGHVQLTFSGTAYSANTSIATVTFNSAYAASPNVVVTGASTSAIAYLYNNPTTTAFQVAFNAGLSGAGLTADFYYMAVA